MTLSLSSSLPSAAARTGSRVRAGLTAGRRPGQWHDVDPVATGRALLLVAGVVVTATAPLLHPGRRGALVLLTVTGAMSLALLVSLAVRWERLSPLSPVVFPVLVWAALAVLGAAGGLGGPYGGLFALCFAYTGLTQSGATSLALVPPAAVAYTIMLGAWSSTLGVRVLIVTAVWVLLSQLLAGLTARQRLLTEALRAAAHTDALTGLPNRRDLQLRLATAASGDSLVLCDLDHFKQLNDTLGHRAGDEVLADFGLLLRTCLRGSDYAARFGGEEFALLLPDTGPTAATAMLQRLQEHWTLLRPDVTFSAGIAQHTAHCSPTGTLETADRALYAAKQAGRNRFCVAESSELHV